MSSLDIDHLQQWTGRSETLHDRITLAPLQALAATLDRDDRAPQPGDALPPCWHWLYFLPLQRASGMGSDGHPRRGGFLPPVPLPRRMWAGSRLEFLQPLLAGEDIVRSSRIADVSAKHGRTGSLVFVRVRHETSGGRGLAIIEQQDIVYREMPQQGDAARAAAPAAATGPAAGSDEQFSRRITPDPVLLFRYSALTFNSHRIHYDRPYATEVEGYRGLVVHGPLIATLLLDLLRRQQPSARVTAFDFKAVSPLLDTAPFDVCGRIDGELATLWARGPDGSLAMQASATLVST